MSRETAPSESEPSAVGEKALALWEIVSVITSCLIAEWAIHTFAGKGSWLVFIPTLLAVGLMVFSYRERGETLHDIGFRFDNFLPSARLLLLPTAAAIALILLVSWWLSGSDFSLRPLRLRLWFIPAWALFQQSVLQGFINRRAQIAFGASFKSIILVALFFSVLHLPSPLLAVLTLLGGLVWAAVYQHQPNLFTLALSHSAVSLALSLTLPANFVHHLRVGFKYFGFVIY